MRLAARKDVRSWIDEGVEVTGYRIEHILGDGHGSELRYAARRRDGTSATVITSPRRYGTRADGPRFRRLATRRRDLQGPVFIPVRQIEEYADHPVLIMDPYPPRTFGDLLEEEAPLAPERVMMLLAPVAEAMDLAHGSGLVHRTLGTDSLSLERSDRLLLDSFGVVIPRDADLQVLNQAGDIRYCAPEQLRGEPMDKAANIYSLTAIVVHALTGEPPYCGEPPAVASSHLVDPPPALSKRVPVLGVEIDAVMRRGLAKDPQARHQSAAELMHDLFDALTFRLAPIPLTSTPRWIRPLASGRRPRATKRRPRESGRRAIARAVLALALAAVCGAVAAAALQPFGGESDRAGRTPAAVAWDRLAGQRVELRHELSAAESAQAQSAAAANLAAAYRSVGAVDQPTRLASVARGASAAYADLAAAAALGSAPAYDDALDAVDDAEREVAAAVGQR